MDASRIATLGAAALALTLSAQGADARMVRYEIDGRAYTYSTNNREQVETARRRIRAADDAAAAKAKAEAELAANPLVRVFGSQAQEAAKAARARLDEVLAGAAAAPSSQERADKRTRATAAVPAVQERADRRARAGASTGSIAISAPAAPKAPAAPRAETIVFDVASGIKTTHLSDGTVQEDLFEAAELAAFKARGRSGQARVTVINEPR